MVKNLPAMQKTLVRSMGKEDALEKGMAITPVFLPGEFHGQRSLAGYSPWGHKELDIIESLRLVDKKKQKKTLCFLNIPIMNDPKGIPIASINPNNLSFWYLACSWSGHGDLLIGLI